MAEIDKFEAMEVKTRKQEEEHQLMLKKKKRNYIIGLSSLGVGVVALITIYCLSAFVWLVDLASLPYIEYSYSTEQGNKVATITDIKPNSGYSSNFRVPEKVNGLIVTGIGENAFSQIDDITRITMPDTVTWIGDYAFSGCKNLEDIEFSKNIKHLGKGLFDDTKYLKKLDPTKTHTVSQILYNVGDDVFDKETILLADHDSVVPDGYGPDVDVKYISDWSSEEVAIGGWGESLFSYNQKLVFVEIPTYLEKVPNESFKGCKNLKAVRFNDVTTEIGKSAFENTAKLEHAELGSHVSKIDDYAFRNSAIKTLNIDHVTELGDNVFEHCTNLETVNWPDGLDIPEGTFKEATALKEFNITEKGFNSIGSIGNYAFQGTSLESFTFPINIDTISVGLFQGAKKLKTVRMYEGTTYYDPIGYELTLGIGTISEYAFSGTSLNEIILFDENKNDVTPAGEINLPCVLTTFRGSSDGSSFASEDGVAPTFTSFTIPSSVVSTNYSMFEGQTSLKTVLFETTHDNTDIMGINIIAYHTFFGCTGIEQLHLPNTVELIEEGAFANMTNLKEIVLPSGEEFSAINTDLFKNDNKLESVNISEYVSTLKEGSFEGVESLKEVFIPYEDASSLSIEAGTFAKYAYGNDEELNDEVPDEDKLHIYLNVSERDISEYVPLPDLSDDGTLNSKGFYDPHSCAAHWLGDWELIDGQRVPVDSVFVDIEGDPYEVSSYEIKQIEGSSEKDLIASKAKVGNTIKLTAEAYEGFKVTGVDLVTSKFDSKLQKEVEVLTPLVFDKESNSYLLEVVDKSDLVLRIETEEVAEA